VSGPWTPTDVPAAAALALFTAHSMPSVTKWTESADRASGYWMTHANTHPVVDARTVGVYWRAAPEDMSILDGSDDEQRSALIKERLRNWKAITKA
jgi:hypothetical protein